jgi:hypothetical protein
MGFLDYAWSVSTQEDKLKARIKLDSELKQPSLAWNNSNFMIVLPEPEISEEGTISYLGYNFPEDTAKANVGKLFRAATAHLTTHTLKPIDNLLYEESSLVKSFSNTLISDQYINQHLSSKQPHRLADIAYVNSLAFARLKPIQRIFNPATRIMAALLTKVNIGMIKGTLKPIEEIAVNQISKKLIILRETITEVNKERSDASSLVEETKQFIIQTLEEHGPILESPSFPHTENTGPCTVFPKLETTSIPEIERIFKKTLENLGYTTTEKPLESYWTKQTEAEAQQALDSWVNQKAREEKIINRINEYLEDTKLKSASFPEEDYSHYLKTRTFLKGGSRRLLDSLRVAMDALDEDPRKEIGQLDMTEVVQKLASNSPRTDVFKQNEYLSKSFAWGILFDVSASMKPKVDLARALAICVAEATKELLMDPGSWSFFAFNDHFHILKDVTEAYSRRVRARIGGLKFEGLTFMPDAIRVAGNILSQRFDEQRFLVVLSDGWPFGYQDIDSELTKSIKALTKKGVIVIGVGLETERMSLFFQTSCAIYNQKDLIKRFAKIYINASTAALEG